MMPGGFAAKDAAGKLYLRNVYGHAHRIEGAPRNLTMNEAKEVAHLIVKLPETEDAASRGLR